MAEGSLLSHDKSIDICPDMCIDMCIDMFIVAIQEDGVLLSEDKCEQLTVDRRIAMAELKRLICDKVAGPGLCSHGLHSYGLNSKHLICDTVAGLYDDGLCSHGLPT